MDNNKLMKSRRKKPDGEKIFGCNLAMYKVHALKNGNRIASMKSIAYTKLEAYYNVAEYFPKHDRFDYEHIRFAKEGETNGPVFEKNDMKRNK